MLQRFVLRQKRRILMKIEQVWESQIHWQVGKHVPKSEVSLFFPSIIHAEAAELIPAGPYTQEPSPTASAQAEATPALAPPLLLLLPPSTKVCRRKSTLCCSHPREDALQPFNETQASIRARSPQGILCTPVYYTRNITTANVTTHFQSAAIFVATAAAAARGCASK
jgi:hypothetical protein